MGNILYNRNVIRSVVLLVVVSNSFNVLSYTNIASVNQIHQSPLDIKIGFLVPFSGNLNEILGPVVPAWVAIINLAIEELNGEQSNYKFSVIIEDTGGNTTMANIGFTNLANENVTGIIGPASTNNLLEIIPLALEHKIPTISYASTGPEISAFDDGGYVFRTVQTDKFPLEVGANLVNFLDFHNLAIIVSNVSSLEFPFLFNSLNTALQEEFIVLDERNEIVSETVIPSSIQELNEAIPNHNITWENFYDKFDIIDDYVRDLAQNIVNNKPEGIYVIASEWSWPLLDKITEIDNTIPYFGFETILSDNSTYFQENTLNETRNGIIISRTDTDSAVPEFREWMIQEFSFPIPFGPELYDAVKLMGYSINNATSLDGIKIVEELEDLGNDYKGVSGTITFDSSGDRNSGKTQIIQIQNDKLVDIGSIREARVFFNLERLDDSKWNPPQETFFDKILTRRNSYILLTGVFVGFITVIGFRYSKKYKRNKQAAEIGFRNYDIMKQAINAGFASEENLTKAKNNGFLVSKAMEYCNNVGLSSVNDLQNKIREIVDLNFEIIYPNKQVNQYQDIIKNLNNPSKLVEFRSTNSEYLTEMKEYFSLLQIMTKFFDNIIQLYNEFSELFTKISKKDIEEFEVSIRKQYQIIEQKVKIVLDQLELRHIWLRAWQPLLTFIQVTGEGVPVGLEEISEVVGYPSDHVKDILLSLLELNPSIGSYDSESDVYVKGSNIQEYLDSALKELEIYKI